VVRPAFWHDVISSGRNVAIERAAVFDGAEVGAVHLDIGDTEALGRQPVAVEPDPGLPRRYWHLHHRRPGGPPRLDTPQPTPPKQPPSRLWTGIFGHRRSLSSSREGGYVPRGYAIKYQ